MIQFWKYILLGDTLGMLFIISLLLFSWQAKEMVELSKSIANKIKDKQGDITEDEVNRLLFKALETTQIMEWCLSSLPICFLNIVFYLF